MDTQFTKYLPLTESTTYILMALAEALHGYALMQKVDEMSQGTVKIGPGTLYRAFSQLKKGIFDYTGQRGGQAKILFAHGRAQWLQYQN